MANVFYITYQGKGSCVHLVPYKAIAHSAEEAIEIINTWKPYGRESYPHFITVNERTAEKIHKLFRDGFGIGYLGKPKTWEIMRTTGCGAWEIVFRPALADTLEEHERIYNEQREAAKAERIRQAEEAKQRRLAELNEQKRGWYHVELMVRLYVFNNHGNDYHEEPTYSCTMIADSGMDAYGKVVKWIKDHPEELTVRGNITALETWAEPTSHNFTFTFLGVKTDEGYSVKLWEEWHKKGEI